MGSWEIDVVVPGKPVTQGSMRVFKGRVVQSAVVKAYRRTIAEALEGMRTASDSYAVELEFGLVRPSSHYGKGRNADVIKVDAPSSPVSQRSGDLDKYVRAVFDAVTESGLWSDDAKVIELRARKTYAEQAFTRIRVAPSSDT